MKICIAGNSGHGLQAVTAAKNNPQVTFVGYCAGYEGEDLQKLEKCFQEVGANPTCFPNFQTMVEKTNPDVLVVDTLFCYHKQLACYALERGIHVYCEKPLALTLLDCDQLQSVAQNSSSVLWSMQTLRYSPWVYTAKKLLDEGVIGNIRMLNCQKSYKLGKRPPFYSDRELYGGTIAWVAIHAIDAIQYLCKEHVQSVYAQQSSGFNKGNGTMEMTAICLFTMDNGVLAHVNADFFRPKNAKTHDDDRVRVVGTEGILEIINNQVYLINDSNDGTKPMELLTPPSIFEDFLLAIEGKSIGEIDTQQSILSTRLALLARESADTNKVVYL